MAGGAKATKRLFPDKEKHGWRAGQVQGLRDVQTAQGQGEDIFFLAVLCFVSSFFSFVCIFFLILLSLGVF